MNLRKYKTDKDKLIKEADEILSSSPETKYLHKVSMVSLMLSGIPASVLSRYCGETARTLTLWVKAVDERGFEALRPIKQTGRPMRLFPLKLLRLGTLSRNPHLLLMELLCLRSLSQSMA